MTETIKSAGKMSGRPTHPTLGTATLFNRNPSLRADAERLQRAASGAEARFLVLVGDKPVISSNATRTEARIRWFDQAEVSALGLSRRTALYLGDAEPNGAPRFALSLEAEMGEHPSAALSPAVDLRSLATQGVMSPEEMSLLGQAKALAGWHATSGYCSRCGTASQITDGGWRRLCPSCGYQLFPRVEPVVIMAITDGLRLVMGRQGHFPEGMYSLPAGFIEPGEDIEHAVRRETFEETGLMVGRVTYVLSQPWPFPHSLMIGCLATYACGELAPDPAELEDARWFAKDEVRTMIAGKHPDGIWVPGAQAIAHALMLLWLDS